MFPIPLYIIILGLSFLISISVYFKVNSSFYLKLFPPLLLATFLVEYYCFEIYARNGNNSLVYNVYAIFEIPFYLYVLKKINSDLKRKNIINYLILLFLIAKVLSFIFQQEGTHHFYAYNIGGAAIIIFSLRHLYQLFVKQSFKSNPFTEVTCWISLGLFCFFTGSFIIVSGFNIYYEMPIKLLNVLRSILLFLNVILYSSFIVAFIINFRKQIVE